MLRHRIVRSDLSSSPHFHPEFGFLCPSQRMRRNLRLAAAFVIVGITAGATAALAFGHLPASDTSRSEPAAFAASVDETPSLAVAAVTSPSPTVAIDPRASARPQGSCQDLSASFLDATCRGGKARKHHAARPGHRVASYIFSTGSHTAN